MREESQPIESLPRGEAGRAPATLVPASLWRRRVVHPLYLVGIVVPLLIWEGAAWWVKLANPERADTILPSIEFVLTDALPKMATFYGMGGVGTEYGAASDYGLAFIVLAYHSAFTILRLLAGVALGAAVGIGTGLLLGWSAHLRAFLQPPLLVVRTVPLLALVPLFLVWFGDAEQGKILFIAFAVFSMLLVNTIEAVRNVPPIYQHYALTQGASRGQVFRTVVLPAIVPELVGGIRVSLGLAWAITLAAEYISAQTGLGRILILSERFIFTGKMVVIVVIFMVYSVALNGLFLQLSRRLTRWMPSA